MCNINIKDIYPEKQNSVTHIKTYKQYPNSNNLPKK